jgi:hypothetical protein
MVAKPKTHVSFFLSTGTEDNEHTFLPSQPALPSDLAVTKQPIASKVIALPSKGGETEGFLHGFPHSMRKLHV